MENNKKSLKKWYPVQYANYWNLQEEPYYDMGVDILDAENVGEEQAEKNAILAASAPEMKMKIEKLSREVLNMFTVYVAEQMMSIVQDHGEHAVWCDRINKWKSEWLQMQENQQQ